MKFLPLVLIAGLAFGQAKGPASSPPTATAPIAVSAANVITCTAAAAGVAGCVAASGNQTLGVNLTAADAGFANLQASQASVGAVGISTDGGISVTQASGAAGAVLTFSGGALQISTATVAANTVQATQLIGATNAASNQLQLKDTTNNKTFYFANNNNRLQVYGNNGSTVVLDVTGDTGLIDTAGDFKLANVPTLISAKPTLTSFAGTGASISGSGASVVINVGTGSPGSSGTLTFGTTATTGYNCQCWLEPQVAAVTTESTSDTTTTCVLTNFTISTGASINWAASSKVHCIIHPY